MEEEIKLKNGSKIMIEESDEPIKAFDEKGDNIIVI